MCCRLRKGQDINGRALSGSSLRGRQITFGLKCFHAGAFSAECDCLRWLHSQPLRKLHALDLGFNPIDELAIG